MLPGKCIFKQWIKQITNFSSKPKTDSLFLFPFFLGQRVIIGLLMWLSLGRGCSYLLSDFWVCAVNGFTGLKPGACGSRGFRPQETWRHSFWMITSMSHGIHCAGGQLAPTFLHLCTSYLSICHCVVCTGTFDSYQLEILVARLSSGPCRYLFKD